MATGAETVAMEANGTPTGKPTAKTGKVAAAGDTAAEAAGADPVAGKPADPVEQVTQLAAQLAAEQALLTTQS